MATRTLAERYELKERIGTGAMGEVWSARDLRTQQAVAVKLPQTWAASDPELAVRFEREGRLLTSIKSPYICAVLDWGRDEDVPFIVLELLEGETLAQLLDREGALPLSDCASIADEILQALVVVHRAGIVHRDLSPSNVLLHRTSDGRVVTKVLDFGVAKVAHTNAPRTGHGATMGALAYVAPEQLGDSAAAAPAADLYAVGTIVFQTLTGRMPFGDARGTALVVMKREHEAPTIDEATDEKWPASVRAFLQKTLARSPAKRYASAELALTAWRDVARGQGAQKQKPNRRT